MQQQTNRQITAAVPKDAAAVILLNKDGTKVLWAQRNPELKFLGGFHGFPGGKLDRDDELCDVRNAEDKERSALLACAVREVFEEIGVLLVRNGEKLTRGQRASLHDDLVAGRFRFSEILETWGLWIDAADFSYTGIWTTPEFSPMRYKTRFFIAVCPEKQIPYPAITELQKIEFIEPNAALKLWNDSNVLIAPPVLISLRALETAIEKHSADDRKMIENSARSLLKTSSRADGNIDFIELNSRLICLPLRTKTLPPATHTNCFIAGGQRFVVIDAAAKVPSEHQKLFSVVDKMIETGAECAAIIVSHLHKDHFGAETALKSHLQTKYSLDVPIAAHQLTAESLDGIVSFDSLIEDQEVFELSDRYGKQFELSALHTPGHARGHLCFYDEELGFLLSSENVVGFGTVVIAPPEGNMIDYLRSLVRMKELPNLNFLCGSHGAANADARLKIEEYIDHRLMREKQIAEALKNGISDAETIAHTVYPHLDPPLMRLGVNSVRAHIEKLQTVGEGLNF